MSRPPNLCIYCGQKGRTKEHYWGTWLTKHLPPIAPNTQHTVSKWDHATGKIDIKNGTLTRQGGLRKQQIKAPCIRCNTGWMRETNELAKDSILRLISDGPIRMTHLQAERFAAWATMLSMTYEFADMGTLVTTQGERDFLMRTRKPPINWAVLIGLFDGEKWKELHNHRAFAGLTEQGFTKHPVAQCNVFTLGRTAVVTLSGWVTERKVLRDFANRHNLRLISPRTISQKGGTKPIFDPQMWEIARYF